MYVHVRVVARLIRCGDFEENQPHPSQASAAIDNGVVEGVLDAADIITVDNGDLFR
jgi:hypothetical protein